MSEGNRIKTISKSRTREAFVYACRRRERPVSIDRETKMRDTHGRRYTRAAFPHNAASSTYSRHRFHTICSILWYNEQPYVAEHRSTKTEALVRCVTDKLQKKSLRVIQLRLSSGGRRCLKACRGKGQQVGTKGHAYRVEHVCL